MKQYILHENGPLFLTGFSQGDSTALGNWCPAVVSWEAFNMLLVLIAICILAVVKIDLLSSRIVCGLY